LSEQANVFLTGKRSGSIKKNESGGAESMIALECDKVFSLEVTLQTKNENRGTKINPKERIKGL